LPVFTKQAGALLYLRKDISCLSSAGDLSGFTLINLSLHQILVCSLFMLIVLVKKVRTDVTLS
jgi:hypothetical protein